jgi:hypothetical protein
LRTECYGEYLDPSKRKGWRTVLCEKLHNLYTSPKIISVIKSRRMRCVGNVAHMGEMGNAYNILFGKP